MTREREWATPSLGAMSTIKRTQIAQAAFDFAGYFTATFSSFRVGGASVRRPALVAPQDMSTSGGKKAKQHIVLQPETPGAPVLTVGWIDLSNGQMCLRTYGCLQEMHAQRFGKQPFDLDPQTYQAFFDQANQFFARQGMRVQIEAQSAITAPPASKSSGTKTILLAVVGVAAVLAILGFGVLGWVYIHYFR